GYFDHPPMVAFLIKLGSYFFEGEIGVRLMSCVFSVGTLYFIWRFIEDPKKHEFVYHFYLLVFSVTLINAYGFFILPDTPLLFFLALFLWVYKNYLKVPGILWALLLGLSMALLMYSKYHAALIILFVLFSNLKLLKDKYAWIALITALVLYLPHLLWLYENDFVSLRYHISERPNRAYEFGDFTLGFFINLIIIFGLTFPWFYKSLFRVKSGDLFTRALVFLVYGFVLFFFISSFNRRIQTQWLIAICIPMLIIAYRSMLQDSSTRRWLLRMGIANCIILLYLRVGLAYAPLFPVHYESHGNKEWVQELVSKIGDKPVVFENSWRLASMFQFYSGKQSYSLNNIFYRHNQYSIDQSEDLVQHRDILFVSMFLEEGDISFKTSPGHALFGVFMPNFESFRKLRCLVDEKYSPSNPKERIFKLYNPYPTDIALSKLKFGVAYLNQYRKVKDTCTVDARLVSEKTDLIKSGDSLAFILELPPTDSLVPTYFKIAISDNDLPFGLNGTNVKLNY
ncbi:MAG: glycosyltransferase family 39 protein, partial [Flavobacteriaceae bacterium]